MATRDDDLHIRLGRIRARGTRRAKPFIAQALTAAEKAGGFNRASRSGARKSTFGRGRAASLAATRLLTDRSRGVVIKARVVRHGLKRAPLSAHLSYLRREGVTRDGGPGKMFDAERDDADHRAFAERSQDDRHHFRFIVSPDDAAELADLKTFTRDLMRQAERDLGTRLDWVGVDHWNTEHPHIHVIVRGRTDDDRDLVISRDYIRAGMRARAEKLVTLELGPRSDIEIMRSLENQIEAERWTRLDRALAREASANEGVIDLRPRRVSRGDELHAIKIGRMRKLERLGVAQPVGTGRWVLDERAEPTLRALGERNDIIKRIHRGLAERGWERGTSGFDLVGEGTTAPIIGRLVARGLDDELKGSAFAVIDGIDGRVHHVRFADLDAAGDSDSGSIVEVRRYEDARGRPRLALAVRSDLSIQGQVGAQGATWLDRQLLAHGTTALSDGGFGREVQTAMDDRAQYLVGEGLARRQGQRLIFARDLLDTLRRRELAAVGAQLSAETGLPYHAVADGSGIGGTYRQRVSLASGRFAMIDNGLGFSLVPWTPSLDRQLGKYLTGRVTGGRIEWDFGRKRGLGL
jgi:type IV secretory pathway VirD2 relaxase